MRRNQDTFTLTKAETICDTGNGKYGLSFRLKAMRPAGNLDLEVGMVSTIHDKWMINYKRQWFFLLYFI